MDDDFADLDGLEFWHTEGCDLQGRRIIRIVSNLLPAFALCKSRLRSYILRQADLLLERLPPDQQLCIVHLNADATWERNSPGVMWLRSLYEDLPRAFRQRVGKVYLVHPGAAVWGSLLLLGPWLSEGLYSKTVYISRLEFLAEHIDMSEDSDELSIPDFVWTHDRDLEQHPLMDYGLQLDPIAARVHMPESMSDACSDIGASES